MIKKCKNAISAAFVLAMLLANQSYSTADTSITYTSLGVPEIDSSFKTYMDYRCVTNTASAQYKLLRTWAWCDGAGFMRCSGERELGIEDDYYCIALGSYYGTEMGAKYRITTDTGNVFYGILADAKADSDTNGTNQYAVYVCETTRYHTKPHPCFDTEITEEILHNMLFQIISKQAQLILNIDDVSNLDKLQLQTEQAVEMQNQIEELKSKKQRLYEQLLMREIELPEYQSEKEKYNEMLKAIQPLYDKSLKETERMKIDAKTRAETVQLAKDIAKENTLTQTLSDMLIDKVLIYPDKRLEVSWKVQDFCREM